MKKLIRRLGLILIIIVASVYKAAGVNAQFLLVDGVGHDRKKLQSSSTDFFKRVLRRW